MSKKVKRIELDRTSHGIVYDKYTFMIDGYLSDYSLNSDDEKSYKDLILRKGYVDDTGKIYIYKENKKEANKLLPVPCFTVNIDEDTGKATYEFFERSKGVDEIFTLENIGSLTNEKIFESIKPDEKLYDEDILNELNSSTSMFRPEIKNSDDFLKRLIKEIILRKEVNIVKYTPLFPKKYILSNLKQGLTNDSKTAAGTFIQWMEMMGIKFHVIIEDNGKDTDPLKEILHYDNYTDTISVIKSVDDVKLLNQEDKKK